MNPEFVCDRCSKCCKTHRVPLTDVDVRRMKADGLALDRAIEFLSPEQVDMEGEPESFVVLKGGRLLMVLAHESTGAASRCVFLGEGGCDIHHARPSACRAYPYDRPEGHAVDQGALGLHPSVVCPPETGLKLPLSDGSQTAAAWTQAVNQRDAELHDYAAFVEAWNRRQGVLVKLGKVPGRTTKFLEECERNSEERVDERRCPRPCG